MAQTAMGARELAGWVKLGVHPHGNRWRHRLRIGGQRPLETFATPQECLERIKALEAQKARGDTFYRPPVDKNRPLGAFADEVHTLEVNGRNRRGDALRANSRRAITFRLRPWRAAPWRDVPPMLVSEAEVSAWYAARYAKAPASAGLELRALQGVLRYAAARGARIDGAVLLMAPLGHTRRRRKALHTAAALEHFASCVPAYARRLVLLQGTVGNRISELLTLTRDRVHLDPDGGPSWLFIPADLCKEGRDKLVYLLPDEVALLAEQIGPARPRAVSLTSSLPPRAASADDLVFPTASGTPWKDTNYRRQVMKAGAQAAAATWPTAWGPNPYLGGFTSHDLRATAITLACAAKIPEAAVAARVGHADGGKLVREIYDQSDRQALAWAAFKALAPAGLRGVATAAQTAAPATEKKATR